MNRCFRLAILFLSWKIWFFALAFIATLILPGFINSFPYRDEILLSTKLPEWLLVFGNFDGVHYIKIARSLYQIEFSQAFFPLFPLLIRLLTPHSISQPFNDPYFNYSLESINYFLSALILSNVFFLAGLYFFYKLLKDCFNNKVASLSMVSLLAFPTAFYFGSIYSESLFFMLTVLFFYFLNKKNWLLASILGGFASATRIIGVALVLVIFIEYFNIYKNNFTKKKLIYLFALLLITGSGLISYSSYLYYALKDPFLYLHVQPFFGAERSADTVILLPQVLFRYLKIFLSVSPSNYIFWVALLEFLTTGVILGLLVKFFPLMRKSWWVFCLLAILIPTLTGTLSSVPRYALMSYLIIPFVIIEYQKYIKPIIAVLFFIQSLLFVLFSRGYWVS